MSPIKIAFIGAGSASFGLNTLACLLRSQHLQGSHLALVDRDLPALHLVGQLAEQLNREWGSGIKITTHSHHQDCGEEKGNREHPLEGADFIILSIETPPRERLWRSDFQTPLKYNIHQPYGENGGPGGFAHAARNIGPVMEIVHALEQHCPNAWLINFSNPLIRICDAIHRYSNIKVVGLCHQILIGYAMIGKALADELNIDAPQDFVSTRVIPELYAVKRYIAHQAMQKVDILAAGINHFTWMMALTDKITGADLLPLFAERWVSLSPTFEPLTRRVYETFGIFPIPGDEHLCEFLPWMSDPLTKPWQKFDLSLYDWDLWESAREDSAVMLTRYINGEKSLEELRHVHSEGALEIIENMANKEESIHPALNLPNKGYIPNLPDQAIVEIPASVDVAGIRGKHVGSLPEAAAELCRRELTVSRLCVDSVINGDRNTALQCLLLDPVIRDMDTAQLILDDYLAVYKEYLPQFWK